MNHDTLVLLLEIFALVVLVALGFWRISKTRSVDNQGERGAGYDMRRDGQRLTT